MERKIPKKLHYIWVGGGKKNALMDRCIQSWKTCCPDYEIIEWNEKNFDTKGHPWVQKAIEQRNWALASDVMRVIILEKHGGIYVDTDIELIKPLDDFLHHSFFIGYESPHWVNSAIIGSEPNHPIMRVIAKRYDKPPEFNGTTNIHTVHAYTAALKLLYDNRPKEGLVVTDDFATYPREYFYPIHYLTGKMKKRTANTYAIHHYSKTWHGKSTRFFEKVAHAGRIFIWPFYWFFELQVARSWRRDLVREFKS